MLCPVCHGKRYLLNPVSANGEQHWKYGCDYCNGQGEYSCCEGSERHGQLPEVRQQGVLPNKVR